MADSNSPRFVVARYLKDHDYNETLQAFLSETDLPSDALSAQPGDWNLEQILREKSLYDQNLNFEKEPDVVATGWSLPCPAKSNEPEKPAAANVLAVTADAKAAQPLIIGSFVNNTLESWQGARPYGPADQLMRGSNNSLSLTITEDYLLTSKMDGTVDIYSRESGRLVATVKVHTSFVNQIVSTWDEDRIVIATAGWDRKASVFCPPLDQLRSMDREDYYGVKTALSPTVDSHQTSANVQSVLFARHPDTDVLYVIYTIRDSIYLHYLQLKPLKQHDGSTRYTATPAGRQSLAPQLHSTWTAFTPAHIEACPTDPTLVAVATSHTPSMKLIVTRLVFPGQADVVANTGATPGSGIYGTKDELAIRFAVSTNAPQNDYSTPRCVWRPDGSGIWVSADDGVIRGVDARTGKVVKQLKGHEPGTKIRCLWAGILPDDNGVKREVMISGGFDKRLIIWENE